MRLTGASQSGGCQCGACRYEFTAAPLALHVCHCLECRRQSASAFGITVTVPAAAFRMVQGAPRQWSRPTASGGITHCFFCPLCGSRLYHLGAAAADEVFVKGGSLDVPPDLSAAVHIWTARRMPGLAIPPGATQYAGEPH